jgi:hypothetical protein
VPWIDLSLDVGAFGYGTAYYAELSVSHNAASQQEDVASREDGKICWRFFASACGICHYRVGQTRTVRAGFEQEGGRDIPPTGEDRCLACYYFQEVLNELASVMHDVGRRDVPAWPRRRITTSDSVGATANASAHRSRKRPSPSGTATSAMKSQCMEAE